MEISPIVLVLIGLVLAGWTVGAGLMMIRASERVRDVASLKSANRRLGRMLDEAPAIPLLVRTDGRIEAPERLAGWLGLERLPAYLSELGGRGEGGLDEDQAGRLTMLVRRTQRTAAPFRLSLTPRGSNQTLGLKGALADPAVSPSGAALIWVFDFTESQDELVSLRRDAQRARTDFAALVGLIEAAPMPMWFRGGDARLRLVNGAYVEAVGAENAEEVVNSQIELVEPTGGTTAGQIAQQAADKGAPIERIVTTTIKRQRRSIRVTDLPLIGEGIAGYAVDIEEMEEQARQFRAFREAQRSMLDQLSIGVALFNANRRMTFANQPFHRVFALPPGIVGERTSLQNLLSAAREKGRLPEVRDFPTWRKEIDDWFAKDVTVEENWPLSDGTHLRIVAQPMPDGGLTLIAEDRTEQLAMSATRDTLLRTRTATFDNLYEALAVFAPDGHLELWNRSFPSVWGIDPQVLEGHPNAERLLDAISPNLAKANQAAMIGNVIRAAALDRKKRDGIVELLDGRIMSYAGVPLPDGNGLLTVLDVTASRRAEEALRERNTALEAADAMMTRFMANMSYEFRTPLTSISGFSELLASGVAGDLSPQALDYVRSIMESSERLIEQVENVLNLSQSEAGLLPLSKQKIDLLPLLTQIVRDREAILKEAGLSLNLRGDPGCIVEADPQQMRRAILNLLQNAIEASDRNGKILLELRERKGSARITIADSGRGMEQDELNRALDGLRPTADGKGVERRQGLGIPLSRQLVEAHDGTMQIVSRAKAGTTVTIKLPVAPK